ncbi:hypothetical protein EMIHUDRAFT_232785 [Emiliania huxleyi CCMP1516]|uniref:Methyltransferase FkbM domain-containing protein n=2 Tax=Emiliania huxleyi TaxID=2903 RepID=A0A0D3K3W9_EMIH1|nr:hypothetical protein EMIHUDRAFT_232785 [Emiliania huxleyi CCMP1516]EOD30454.1 hypothetical protein EMIHUDRAFT_232785 [Emiliania huxleyi CCMP1516]|eukprot:XP_005782883.1 hypothetical protein EMIHUDRAFT_232785 [Emiliania huxleyi CCMP1516]
MSAMQAEIEALKSANGTEARHAPPHGTGSHGAGALGGGSADFMAMPNCSMPAHTIETTAMKSAAGRRWCEILRSASAATLMLMSPPNSNPRYQQEAYMRSPRFEAIAGMGFHTDESGCAVPHFLSQLGQDWWIYMNHARFMKRQGTYVDLAANDAMVISNTFFFDTCLGWRGVCVEPNPAHHARLRSERTCALEARAVSTCAREGDAALQLVTRHDAGDKIGGHSHLGSPMPSDRAHRASVVKIAGCTSFTDALASQQIDHVDFLSLDIEGHEVAALRSLDWAKVTIDIIISENPRVVPLLCGEQNYSQVSIFSSGQAERAYLRPGFRLLAEVNGEQVHRVPRPTKGRGGGRVRRR